LWLSCLFKEKNRFGDFFFLKTNLQQNIPFSNYFSQNGGNSPPKKSLRHTLRNQRTIDMEIYLTFKNNT